MTEYFEYFPSCVSEARPAGGREGLAVRGLHCIPLQRLFGLQASRCADRQTASLCHAWAQYVSPAPMDPRHHTWRSPKKE